MSGAVLEAIHCLALVEKAPPIPEGFFNSDSVLCRYEISGLDPVPWTVHSGDGLDCDSTAIILSR